MDEQLKIRIDAIEKKIDAIYASTEKTRKYFLATLIISLVLFILPLLGLAFAIPAFMSNYTGQFDTLMQQQ
jgi:uncharacterized BrkB/YihY/UPF0761 family membrane protein